MFLLKTITYKLGIIMFDEKFEVRLLFNEISCKCKDNGDRTSAVLLDMISLLSKKNRSKDVLLR